MHGLPMKRCTGSYDYEMEFLKFKYNLLGTEAEAGRSQSETKNTFFLVKSCSDNKLSIHPKTKNKKFWVLPKTDYPTTWLIYSV